MRVEVRYIPGRLYNSANVVDRILRIDKTFFLQTWRSSKCNGVLDRSRRYFPGSLRYQWCILSKKKKKTVKIKSGNHVHWQKSACQSSSGQCAEWKFGTFPRNKIANVYREEGLTCSGIFWLFRTGFLIKSKSLIFRTSVCQYFNKFTYLKFDINLLILWSVSPH